MIKLTNPSHGWITFRIKYAENSCLEIDFSDVGPNSIAELKSAADSLKKGDGKLNVEFFLEPSIAKLQLSKCGGQLNITYFVDQKREDSFTVDCQTFVDSLTKEIERISPLCVGYNWSQEII